MQKVEGSFNVRKLIYATYQTIKETNKLNNHLSRFTDILLKINHARILFLKKSQNIGH